VWIEIFPVALKETIVASGGKALIAVFLKPLKNRRAGFVDL
jgi:hypothetical protein